MRIDEAKLRETIKRLLIESDVKFSDPNSIIKYNGDILYQDASNLDEFIDLLDNSHLDRLDKLYSEYAFRDIFQLILNLFQQLNGWLTDKEPWKIKDNSELKAKILRVGLERLYQLNHLLIPIMPETSDKIFVLINRTTLTYQKLREYNRTLHEGFNDLVLEKYKMILFPKIETEMEVQIKLSKKKNPKGKN